MNVRTLILLTVIAFPVALNAQSSNQAPSPNPVPAPAAVTPGASTPESGSRSDTTSSKSTPSANTPRGESLPLPPVPMSPTRADDSYAIYSLLMPGSYLLNLGPDNNQTWLVADATIVRGAPDDRVASARRCIQPPADRQQDFKSVFDDFDKHKSESIQLERDLQVQIPYKLVNDQQRQAFADTRTANAPAPDTATTDEFRGAPGITYFSQVYFNIDNSLALVYMQEFCGPKCGEGKWIALEKVTGNWVRRNWNACSLAN
jgi:hypothetical protein